MIREVQMGPVSGVSEPFSTVFIRFPAVWSRILAETRQFLICQMSSIPIKVKVVKRGNAVMVPFWTIFRLLLYNFSALFEVFLGLVPAFFLAIFLGFFISLTFYRLILTFFRPFSTFFSNF